MSYWGWFCLQFGFFSPVLKKVGSPAVLCRHISISKSFWRLQMFFGPLRSVCIALRGSRGFWPGGSLYYCRFLGFSWDIPSVSMKQSTLEMVKYGIRSYGISSYLYKNIGYSRYKWYLGASPDLGRAEGTWTLECASSFEVVYAPICMVMAQSATFSRCFLVTGSFVVVGQAFPNQCFRGEESNFIIQQAE